MLTEVVPGGPNGAGLEGIDGALALVEHLGHLWGSQPHSSLVYKLAS